MKGYRFLLWRGCQLQQRDNSDAYEALHLPLEMSHDTTPSIVLPV